MNRTLLLIPLLILTGCASSPGSKTTVIVPPSTATAQPQVKWEKRGNVYYLKFNQPQ